MSGISKYQANELADLWEARTGIEQDARVCEVLRECADTVRMLASVKAGPRCCPRAPEPFNFCPDCDGTFPCQLPGVKQHG